MPSHNQVAKSVREDKLINPLRYCPVRGCLWKTATPKGNTYILNSNPCRKHQSRTPSSVEAVSPETRALAEDPRPTNLVNAGYVVSIVDGDASYEDIIAELRDRGYHYSKLAPGFYVS